VELEVHLLEVLEVETGKHLLVFHVEAEGVLIDAARKLDGVFEDVIDHQLGDAGQVQKLGVGLVELFELEVHLHQLYQLHVGCKLLDRVLISIVLLVEVLHKLIEEMVVIVNICF